MSFPCRSLGAAIFAVLSIQSAPLNAAPVMTAISETSNNKDYERGSPERPVYYALQSDGFRAIGGTAAMSPIPGDGIERAVREAVSSLGYQPAPEGHVPAVLVTFSWGVYALPIACDAKTLIERAAFVGGKEFATKLRKALEESAATSFATPTAPDSSFSAAVGVRQMASINDPLRRFRESTTKNDDLLNQTTSEVYYVIISTYDARSLATNKKLLLWRTRMAVQSVGTSPDDSLPRLIAAAAPFFGRNLNEAEILVAKQEAAKSGK